MAQSMVVIILGRLLISIFSTLIAWCGLTWHIGFTIQNRFSWGLRASYIPLLQRILLNFIWVCQPPLLTHLVSKKAHCILPHFLPLSPSLHPVSLMLMIIERSRTRSSAGTAGA